LYKQIDYSTDSPDLDLECQRKRCKRSKAR
jgi:hypothetical protein